MSQQGDGTIIFKELCRQLALRRQAEREQEADHHIRQRGDAMRRAGVSVPFYPLEGMEE